MMRRKAFILAALAAALPIRVEAAATLAVTSVDRSHPGVVHIAVRYRGGRTPSFRLTPTCGSGAPGEWVVASTLRVVPARRRALLELRDADLAGLGDPRVPCPARALTVEMLEGSRVVARAEVPIDVPAPRALTAPPPAPPEPAMPQLGVVGMKLRGPQTKMTEAGISWSLTDRLTLNLSYERTAYAPLMPRDHDDGIVTGVKLGF